MTATAPPALSPILPFPALSERAAGTYNLSAYNCLNGWAVTYGPQLAALAANVYANAVDAAGSAAAAAASAASAAAQVGQATTQANNAAAAANFKGTWSSLSGSISKPASVLHNGSIWVLLANIADVTTQPPVPGSAYWFALSTASAASSIYLSQTFGGI